jgi:formylglycine-generating enzyme required for sulfatase activity
MARELNKLSVAELDELEDAIDHAPTDDFAELIRVAGLDPTSELRFGDFSGCGFDGDHLLGFNFTGCDLTGASFNDARIAGAKFDCAKVQLGALAKAADFDAYLKWELRRRPKGRFPLNPSRLRDLAIFREAPFAPEMVVIPAGEFMMGSDVGEAGLGEDDKAWDDEIVPGQGKRPMRVPRRFAMGRYPVMFEEYDLFCEAEQRQKPKDEGWGRGRRPVINVSWDDAQAYVAWLNGKIGGAAYRLPSDAEWEYACRAGTDTRRWWGDAWEAIRANGVRSFEGGRTSPVGSFPPNAWELSDTIGNVWEWCADEWVESIAFLPENALRFHHETDEKINTPRERTLRGGAWYNQPGYLRSAFRSNGGPVPQGNAIGFRLSRSLDEAAAPRNSPDAFEAKIDRLRRPLVMLHVEEAQNHYPELVRMEFRRDDRPPQPEGDPIAIDYHISVQTDWLYQGRNRRIGIRELTVSVIAAAGHAGELRKPAQSARIRGVGLKIHGVRSELRADFAVEDPQAHLDLNGLDDAILLAIYERGRAGDGLTIELFVDLDHGFACVRAPNDPPAAPRTPRKFREKVIEHLAKRAVLSDLALAPHVTLCSQGLKIALEPEESP